MIETDLHVTEVEQADVSQIDRLRMQHRLWAHRQRDAEVSTFQHDTRTGPKASKVQAIQPIVAPLALWT